MEKKLCLKKVLVWILTLSFLMPIIPSTGQTVYGAAIYTIDSTDVYKLTEQLNSIATVSSDEENVITITLKSNIASMLVFDVEDENSSFILDAAGYTIDPANENESIQLSNKNNSSVTLKGNGTYKGGFNNTIYVGDGNLYIENGTFKEPTTNNGYIIRGSAYIKLVDGYDYYTATIGGATTFSSTFHDYNRIQKMISGGTKGSGELVVTQCKGVLPEYNIKAESTENGQYSFLVNGKNNTKAKPDDEISVSFSPDDNYRAKTTKVYKIEGEEKIYYNSVLNPLKEGWKFNMPQSDIYMEVTFEWENKIVTQPTAKNPTVLTNAPEKVKGYQWYKKSVKEMLMVEGEEGNNEISSSSVGYIRDGQYDTDTKTWSSSYLSQISIESYFLYSEDVVVIIPKNGEIVSVTNGIKESDGSYKCQGGSEITVSFTDDTGSCQVKIYKNVEEEIEGQTTATYTGSDGKVYCKIQYENLSYLNSDTIVIKAHECSADTLTQHTKVAATCTQNGTDKYYECSCGKLYSDSTAATEIKIVPVIAATGHRYASTWKNDNVYHWHAATCVHTTAISQKVKHNYGGDNICDTCKYVNRLETTKAPSSEQKKPIPVGKVKISKIKSVTYSGYAQKPKFSLKYKEKKLKKGRDYTITYKNNIKAGVGKIIIKGRGNYTGKKTVQFKIKKREVGVYKKGIYRVTCKALNVRSGPSKTFGMVDALYKNDKVEVVKVIQRYKDGKKYVWLQIKNNKKFNKNKYYIYSEYVK